MPANVTIGGLVPRTGDSATSGAEIQAGLMEGISDFNSRKSGIMLQLEIGDTGMGSSAANSTFQNLRNMGITLFTGGFSSANLISIKEGNDLSKAVIVSCCSASPDERIASPDDTVFRLFPPADIQARDLAQQVYNRGYRQLGIIHRNDTWGMALNSAVEDTFGGTVFLSEAYNLPASNMTIVNTVNLVANSLNTALNSISIGETAIALFGFGADTAGILNAASDVGPPLSQVKWYSIELYADVTDRAGAFAELVDFEASVVAPDLSHPEFQQISDRIMRRGNLTQSPSPLAYAAYDSIQILGRTLNQVSDTNNITAIKVALPSVAASYSGLLGNSTLNENGDLASADFEFWVVRCLST